MAIMEGITDQDVIDTIHYHHERWDGTGYPSGLKGNDIPVYARICSILDAFDCMISDRPYKKRDVHTARSRRTAEPELFAI